MCRELLLHEMVSPKGHLHVLLKKQKNQNLCQLFRLKQWETPKVNAWDGSRFLAGVSEARGAAGL